MIIGVNSTILQGVTIGSNVIIGAGSIITKDVPSNTVCAGVPAKVLCSLDDYMKKNSKNFIHTKHLNPMRKKHFLLKVFKN